MLTIDNIIKILFQIGFHDMEECEIVFNSYEEKIDYRSGIKKFLIKNKDSFTIDYNTKDVILYVDNDKGIYLKQFYLDDMKNISQALNNEYAKELRKLKIENIINDRE